MTKFFLLFLQNICIFVIFIVNLQPILLKIGINQFYFEENEQAETFFAG